MRCTTKGRKRNALINDYVSMMGGAVLRHRAEIAERAKRIEAERANKVTSQFIANMSHELRTPLNAIIGFSEFMRNTGLKDLGEERQKEYSGYIYSASIHLLKIFNNIIDISKIHAGSMVIDRQDVSVTDVLQPCIRSLSATIGAKGPAITERVSADLPNVFADLVRLEQIFTNILENALKFTPPEGTITVAAQEAPGDIVKVTVSDTGKGMSAEEARIAASPFAQAKGEIKSEAGGLGLGLAIAKALVELHGGKLAIAAKPGVGTRVTVLLPAGVSATDAARGGAAVAADAPQARDLGAA